MISPNSFCGFIFTRAIDMNLDPPILQNPWTKMKKTIWFINRKVLGARKFFLKHIEIYLKLYEILPKIGLRRFPLIITSEPEVLIKKSNDRQGRK